MRGSLKAARRSLAKDFSSRSVSFWPGRRTTVAYFEYGRDVAGRILRIERETDLSVYYEHDAIDRLTAETWRHTSSFHQHCLSAR